MTATDTPTHGLRRINRGRGHGYSPEKETTA